MTVTAAMTECPGALRPERPDHGNLSLGGLVPVGALLFWGRLADARPMPRYFFILAYPDNEIGDPKGMILPSDEAAIKAARQAIDEMLADRGPNDPNVTAIVKNGAGEVIYRFPSN